MVADLKISYVRDRLEYDPETGSLVWKPVTASMCAGSHWRSPDLEAADFNRDLAGREAYLNERRRGASARYHMVSIGGRVVSAHRLAWAIHYGVWPDSPIDHINGDGLDNRVQNLRKATPSQNARNRRSAEGSSSSYLGVFWNADAKKWRASITHGETSTYLGDFEDERDAARAYDAAAIMMHREFARPNIFDNPYCKRA